MHVSIGQKVVLWPAGPFTATGVCLLNASGESEALSYLTTSASHSSMASHYNVYERADFDPGDEPLIGSRVESKGPEVGEYENSTTLAEVRFRAAARARR
jgi:hypothetical protein